MSPSIKNTVEYHNQKNVSVHVPGQSEHHWDSSFPANQQSIGDIPNTDWSDVCWKRPHQLVHRPRLFAKDIQQPFLVKQGAIGDCWLIAALCSLIRTPALIACIVPDWQRQDYNQHTPHTHPGIFHLKLWRHGSWLNVFVDDRLPCSIRHHRLLFAHSTNRNEFWSALVEKAVAKLLGSYAALHNGTLLDGLLDLTGGIHEHFFLQQTSDDSKTTKSIVVPAKPNSEKLVAHVATILHKGGHVCLCVDGLGLGELNENTQMVTNHCYVLLQVLRDGLGQAWVELLEPIQLERCWLPFDRVVGHCTELVICHPPQIASSRPTLKYYIGSWLAPSLSGGSPNHRQSCLQNPACLIQVNRAQASCTFALEQTSRSLAPVAGIFLLRITKSVPELMACSQYINTRQTTLTIQLQRGQYAVVASTWRPLVEGSFVLSVRAPANVTFTPLTDSLQTVLLNNQSITNQ